MSEVKKTAFLDSNNRIINMAKNAHDGRKKVFFVKKLNPLTGKFIRAYRRKASVRRDGRNIANHKTVPVTIRNKMNMVPMHNTTMNGLNHWHKHLFEHFGWMILAKAKGYGYKIPTYKKSIEHFIKTAEKSMSNYSESNRKRDVKILLRNVKVLKKHAKML